MSSIYTRSGDKGTTGIHGGERVLKTDIRIEANGTIDELNVAVGAVRSVIGQNHEWQLLLKHIQINLMSIMSLVATPDKLRNNNPNKLPEDLVREIEINIDKINSRISTPNCFILPGGNSLSILLHQVRVLARRAERRLWQLNEKDKVPDLILQYFNRLSDLFFIMARYELEISDVKEEIWNNFGYKRSLK